jgi:hypothetical protein
LLPTVSLFRWRAGACALGVALLIAQGGCAPVAPGTGVGSPESGGAPSATPGTAPPQPSNVEPPPPNVNLSGFPLPYRQGYADGCASLGGKERKDAARFASDGNYRTGWQDGQALCARK